MGALLAQALMLHSQTPANPGSPSPFSNFQTIAPKQDKQSGLVMRGIIGGTGHPWFPTNFLVIAKSGKEWNEQFKEKIAQQLRGSLDVTWLQFEGHGYIVLDADSTIAFDLDNNSISVDGKDFGAGKFSQPIKKGTHLIEIKRADWAKPQGDFQVTDPASGKSVLFYTPELLKKELAKSVKLNKRTLPSKLLDATDPAAPK